MKAFQSLPSSQNSTDIFRDDSYPKENTEVYSRGLQGKTFLLQTLLAFSGMCGPSLRYGNHTGYQIPGRTPLLRA